MIDTETHDSKTCPDCNKINAFQNLRCIGCGASMLNVPSEPFWKEDEVANNGLEGIGNLFFEIMVSVVFLFTIPLGIFLSRWFLLLGLALLIFMVRNNYSSFLVQVLSRGFRR
jgi:hypothetical protein